MIQEAEKQKIIDQLRQLPIVEVACKKIGVSRATFYRWKKDDPAFAKAVNESMNEGEQMITDMSESQLIGLIKDRSFPSIQLWLKTHHPKYADRLKIDATITEELTPEQEILFKEAMKLTGLLNQENEPQQNNEQPNR